MTREQAQHVRAARLQLDEGRAERRLIELGVEELTGRADQQTDGPRFRDRDGGCEEELRLEGDELRRQQRMARRSFGPRSLPALRDFR